jgi:hypothetical protein
LEGVVHVPDRLVHLERDPLPVHLDPTDPALRHLPHAPEERHPDGVDDPLDGEVHSVERATQRLPLRDGLLIEDDPESDCFLLHRLEVPAELGEGLRQPGPAASE